VPLFCRQVDIDQTLSGIDKLLKSQELTFAFVGVAPALAIVYVVAGYLRRLWSGGRGRGLYGGKNNRTMAWVTMRSVNLILCFILPHWNSIQENRTIAYCSASRSSDNY
jgi:nuclear-control-of-ATPase protein 2